MNHILLSVALLIFLTPEISFSDVELASGFNFTVPNVAVDKEVYGILQNNSNLNFAISDQTVNVGVPVSISGINAQVSYTLSNSTPVTSGKLWSMTSLLSSGSINIGQVTASQNIQEVISGVIVNLSLNATCTGISLTLTPGTSSFSATFALNASQNQLSLQVSSFSMNWAPGAWTINPFTCSGAQGFGDQVASQINSYLSDPSKLQPFIQNYIQNYINQTLTQAFQDLFSGMTLNTGRTDLTLSLQGSSFAAINGGYQLTGTALLDLPLANPGETTLTQMAGPQAPVLSGSETLSFLSFPEGFLTAFLANVQYTSLLQKTFTSNDVPAIKSLIHSFFEKLFVLPDLFAFSSKAVFNFSTSTSTPVNFVPDDTSQVMSSVLSGHVSGIFKAAVSAPKKQGYVPYLNFSDILGANISIALTNGQVSATISHTTSQLSSAWDANYVKQYHPDKSVSNGLINDSLKSTLNSIVLTYQFPILNLGKLNSFQATSLVHDPVNKSVHVSFDSK